MKFPYKRLAKMILLTYKFLAHLAQLVERRACNRKLAGSRPCQGWDLSATSLGKGLYSNFLTLPRCKMGA